MQADSHSPMIPLGGSVTLALRETVYPVIFPSASFSAVWVSVMIRSYESPAMLSRISSAAELTVR